jgi:hypothetical protein
MSIESKILCGAQVYYDDYENRWVRAIGPDVRSWEMRYGTDFTTAKEYTNTVIDVGAGTSLASQGITAGDRCLITTAQNENDSVELQVVGTPFQLAAGHPLYFGAKLSISDATQSDLFIGLASKDPNIIAAHAIALADDGVYFYKLDGGTVIYGAEEKSGTVAATACGTAMDISKHIYEIYYDGVGSVSFYFDGGLVVKASSGYPTVVLSPSVGLAAGAAAAKTGLIEWMRCIQL